MSTNKSTSLNEQITKLVTLGDNSTMVVMGKGNVKFKVSVIVQVITEVFSVPDLKDNLLSIG